MEINDIINGLNCSSDSNCGCNNPINPAGLGCGGLGGLGGSWIWIIILLFLFCGCGGRGTSPLGGMYNNSDYKDCMCECMCSKKKDKKNNTVCCCGQKNNTNSLFGGTSSGWLFLLVLLFICSGSGSILGNCLGSGVGGTSATSDIFGGCGC